MSIIKFIQTRLTWTGRKMAFKENGLSSKFEDTEQIRNLFKKFACRNFFKEKRTKNSCTVFLAAQKVTKSLIPLDCPSVRNPL